jgi:hypothetical protein
MFLRQMQLLICMVGLLGEHCDFDQVRLDRQGRISPRRKNLTNTPADLAREIDQITKVLAFDKEFRPFIDLTSGIRFPPHLPHVFTPF